MRKSYTSFFTTCFLFLTLGLATLHVNAQTPTYFKGLGTSTNTIPMNTAGSHTQQIYLPADFNMVPPGANLINKIYFRNSVAGGTGTYTNFSVAFLQNNMAAFPDNTFLTGFTTALSAPTITINGNATAGGWYEIPLATPFPYDNTKTLIVEIKYTSRTGGMSGYTTTAVGNKRLSIITAPGPATGNLSTLWGDFGMDMIPAGPCINPPVPGTVTASTAVACIGVPFSLNMTGGTNGSGQTYQWQISPNGTSWTDIPGATQQFLNTSQTSSNFYQLLVTCGTTVASNAVQVLTPNAVSGVFTINNAQPTGGTNFNSFNDAYDYIKCGINGAVTFNVDAASGPYNEQLIMIPVPGASATNTVTFNGNGRTLQNTSTNTNERAVIKLNGADHIKFNNLVINANGSGTGQYGFGVHLINDADSNSVNGCTINVNTIETSTNYGGIIMSASNTSATGTGTTLCDANRFTNNTINGGYYGITLVGSSTSAVRENIVKNNIIRDFYTYGIYSTGNFGTLVDSNTISRPTRNNTGTTTYGIYYTGLSTLVNVTRNTISDPFGGIPTNAGDFNGIMFTGVDALTTLENKVINNKLYNFTGAGTMNAINLTGSDNIQVYHNTVRMDGTGGTEIVRGIYQTTAAGGVSVQNNIIVINRGGTGNKFGLAYATTTSEILSNFNDIFIATGITNAFTGIWGTANQATLLDWQTATTKDANSIASNPFFVNATTGNLMPTNASVDNLGTPLGITNDILGASRSATTPDMGAYEFTPGPCSAPPVAGVAAVSPTVVCAGEPVQLTVSANSTGLGQTYQWQFSTNIAGPYTLIGVPGTNPVLSVNATVTGYYQLAVTCNAQTEFSTPILLTVNPALPAGTYTINSAQPTAGTNYNSFTAVAAALQCGIAGPVVFNVDPASGPYNEQFILGAINGTSATNTITINGNGRTIAFSSSTDDERAVIKFDGTDHVKIDSLVIDANGAGTYGIGVHIVNNADSNTINNCTVLNNTTSTSTNFAGLVISASETSATGTGNSLCDGNTFSNNRITGGYYGITLVGGTTTFNSNNKAIGNTIKDFYSYGVYTAGNVNALVERNDISRPARTNTTTHYGVHGTGIQQGLKINANRIHASFEQVQTSTSVFYGVYLTGVDAVNTTPTIVSNNLVYNQKSSGTQYGLYNTSSAAAKYYHNTIVLNADDVTETAASYGFYQTTLAVDIDVKNNLFAVTRAGSGDKYGIYKATSTSVITHDFNNFYITGTNAFIGFNGTDHATLAAWQAATSQDASSLTQVPVFAGAASGNYAPFNPALDNKGTPVGITTDINNSSRSATTPDIGAYEFSIPPCTAPPAVGGATAVPNSGICIGATIQLSLGGYNIGAGQTFQWQTSTSASGPWTDLGSPLIFPDTTIFATATLYYRALVTCSGNTSPSTPALVTLNPAFLAGTYTINSTIPASATNFTSFASAVLALECGITGPVFFDVAPNTYTEQIRMHHVPGTSPTVRVTFRSANGNPASVILTNNATVATANYTLQLDSASYITYQNMTINATNTTNGRVIELANTASHDSIVNCIINAPVTAGTANTSAGIYADLLRGSGNIIKGNTINNGNMGIYLEGNATTNLTYDNVIDSNTVNTAYYYSIYLGMNGRAKVNKNTVNITMPRNATNYGIYSTSSDSAYQYTANKVNITGVTATTTYGMYFTGCDGGQNTRGRIAGNTITALTGNTGALYGMYQTASTHNNTVNNVISIATTNATAYASYYTGGGGVRFHNNSIMNASASTGTTNAAGYFTQTSGTNGAVNVQNNIFTHTGGGNAFYMANLNFVYSNYNTYHTASAPLFRTSATVTYATLPLWINFSNWDYNSINFQPKLVDNISLMPNLADPDVWAIHGRGTQIEGNDYDFNNNPRPTTFTAGVPDMGAYEFLPTAQPTVLTATPAAPAPGITQTFMYGTDTVAKITYSATAPVPASINLRRYSGVLPTGLAPGQQSMYFYTDIDVPAQGAYKYKIDQHYIDPWRGFIPSEGQVQLGKTNATNAWVVQPLATTNTFDNIMSDTGQVYIDKFTGLTGNPPNTGGGVYTTVTDSSNGGTRFWVPYGHHQAMSSNVQDMWLYLSAIDSANVTVRINGTNWVRNYAIPDNTVRVSDIMPKSGLVDSRITDEGLFEHGISITSDVPIVVYAHIYDGANSGASLVMPVGVYGYEYQSLNSRQFYSTDTYSWMSVISDRDSALVEITPSVPTKGGRPAGVPFQVYLMRGQVYNIMGVVPTAATATELTGTKVKSIPNASGECYPVAVFSGSSRTAICNTTNGDNMIQQVFPNHAWGRKYALFATANTLSNTNYNANLYRVMVKDPTTVVRRNGAVLDPATMIVPGNFYEFSTNYGTGPSTATYIESDKPVMVAQYMISTGGGASCGLTAPTGGGDPEMMYISPIEQGIKQAYFYNTTESAITANYVNIVIPTAGLASLRLDGTISTFTDVFPHPSLPGYTCIRHNLGGTAGQHSLSSDSAFTSITYGLGSVESYGYNTGTLVRNLNAIPSISNTLGSGGTSQYTCVNAPFRFSTLFTSKPLSITWKLSELSTVIPNADVVQNNPQPVDSIFSNGRWLYRFTIPTDYKFTQAGTFVVRILINDPVNIQGCNSTMEVLMSVTVIPAPTASFTAPPVCFGNPAVFTGTGTTSNNTPIATWSWNFGDTNTGNTQNPTHLYGAPGTYNAAFSLIAQDGCISDTVRQDVIVNPGPAVAVVEDSLVVCGASPATFEVQNPVAGTVYSWYNVATGGTAIATGASYTIPAVLGTTVLWVEPVSSAGCIGARVRVVATLLPDLAIPVVQVDSTGVDWITFSWTSVPNALSYEVSTNGGSSWSTPSSGPTGLTHTVTGLLPLTDVSLRVRAIGSAPCQVSTSADVTGRTKPDQIYIPNAFSPNGDGLNDVLRVYGYTIQSLRMIVFNQWGEKIFESFNQATGWDGRHKGKDQPSGVYMYVIEVVLRDGTKQVKKGSINLVR